MCTEFSFNRVVNVYVRDISYLMVDGYQLDCLMLHLIVLSSQQGYDLRISTLSINAEKVLK